MKPPMPLHQCRLYKCRSMKTLSRVLYVSVRDLTNTHRWISYRTRSEQKPNGGMRPIYSPNKKLKRAQKRIKQLLERIEKPDWVFSGTKGVCHVDNATYHKGNTYFVLADLSSFYENCTRDAVYRFFNGQMHTAPDVAEVLTDLTTWTNQDGHQMIPTGSPTGQLLAFFAYRSMFEELEACAKDYGCRLSLYVDDLTLSSDKPIPNPQGLAKQMARIMNAYGHRINWKKTRYAGRHSYKIVTGVALDEDGNPRVPNALRKKTIDGLASYKAGEISAQAPTIGRVNAARQIEPGIFSEVERLVSAEPIA